MKFLINKSANNSAQVYHAIMLSNYQEPNIFRMKTFVKKYLSLPSCFSEKTNFVENYNQNTRN